MSFVLSLVLAFILDRIFGDPYNIPHPVVLIGKFISKSENFLRKVFKEKNLFFAGVILWIIVISVSFIIPFSVIKIVEKISPVLSFLLQTFWCYQILAGKCLETESLKVYKALEENDLVKARQMLSYIVGRDTENLNEQEIIKATVETVAENTSDGVTAPLFYILLGGVPLGFLYKAVNTLDSMVGYKNEKYILFGKFSAYMDDLFNFISSRLTALFMIIASFILSYDGKSALKIFLRDRKKHLSPNSAQTESVTAGALNIQLGGTHDYFGKPVFKETIGDDIRKAENDDIKKSCELMKISSILFLFFGTVIYLVIR